MSPLSWFRRRPVPPAGSKPETDWHDMGCARRCKYDHALVFGVCAYAPEQVGADGDPPDPLVEIDDLMAEIVAESEFDGRALERLAVLTDSGVSPWDAAVRVFGGAAVARDAPGAGLYASVAGEPAGSIHG